MKSTKESVVDLSKFDDLVTQLQAASDKARCLMNEMSQEYFGFPDMVPGSEHASELFFYYNEYGTKAEIVFDYIVKMQQITSELREIKDQAFEEIDKLKAAV